MGQQCHLENVMEEVENKRLHRDFQASLGLQIQTKHTHTALHCTHGKHDAAKAVIDHI